MCESFGDFIEIGDCNGNIFSSDLSPFVCLTEVAYKALVSSETKDKFLNNSFVQVKLSDQQIIDKLKEYKIDLENKDFRIIKPIFNSKSYDFRNKVIATSLLKEIKDNIIIWN